MSLIKGSTVKITELQSVLNFPPPCATVERGVAFIDLDDQPFLPDSYVILNDRRREARGIEIVCVSRNDGKLTFSSLNDTVNRSTVYCGIIYVYSGVLLCAGRLRYLCVCLSVCRCVCPAPQILPLRAIERPIEVTYGFGAIWETFKIWRFL